MKIQYKNSIEELEILVKHFCDELTNIFKISKYLLAIIPIVFIITSIGDNEPIWLYIFFIIIIPISYFIGKKIEPISKKNACIKTIEKMKKESGYYLSKKTLELKDNYILIDSGFESIKLNLKSSTLLSELDDYIILVDPLISSFKYKLIIPNKCFDNYEQKNIFIEKIKSKIKNKKVD